MDALKPDASHPLGELLYLTEDALGPIHVYQRRSQRFLTFGNQVEQSCIELGNPHRLEHVYTQAMMLGLLLTEAHQALLLGVGGGSLLRALRHARPKMALDAVEFRPAVIEVAREYFGLPDDSRTQIHCMDALAYLSDDRSHYDLLITDLYLADGAHALQSRIDFLQRCREHLSETGVLMANHWCSEFRDSQRNQQALRTVFGEQLLFLQVEGGNSIAFGFRNQPSRINRNPLFEQAQALGMQLEIPLHRLARNFWRQNAQALQVGRFSRRY